MIFQQICFLDCTNVFNILACSPDTTIRSVLFSLLCSCQQRSNSIKAAWYRNWYRHVTILGDIVAPEYIETSSTLVSKRWYRYSWY